MKYVYLLIAGLSASLAHGWLVWHHRDNRKYSISEHAIIDKRSHALYVVAHIICDIFALLYAHQFFVVEQAMYAPFYLFVGFATLDFVQAIVPSRAKTERLHFTAAYVSWICYLLAGVTSLVSLQISQPYRALAWATLIPVVGMFLYMHINRSKLYPYQVLMVPLFVVVMLLATIGTA